MKVTIFGATGLVGSELARALAARGHAVTALSHADCDVTNAEEVRRVLAEHKPELVVNCAVILDVDKCEANPALCYAVNRDGVENVLPACAALGTKPVFLQISSSETFGRVHEGEYDPLGYKEDDIQKPASVYQKSKKEAEDVLLRFVKENPTALRAWYIVRAGWLYGEGRQTFVDRFVTLLQSKKPLTVVKDQWRSPTWTHDFADGLGSLLDGDYPSGIYHIVNEVKPGEATTMDVIDEIERFLGDRAAHPEKVLVAFKDFFKVPRAPVNVLKNTKLPKLRPWREALQEYLVKRYPNS